jgi:hypothetical protein
MLWIRARQCEIVRQCVTASSKETPCFRRFAAAFAGSRSHFMCGVYSDVQPGSGFGCGFDGRCNDPFPQNQISLGEACHKLFRSVREGKRQDLATSLARRVLRTGIPIPASDFPFQRTAELPEFVCEG